MNTPPPPRRVALLGMMGSGKSTLGRAVSTELALPFIDADDAIEADAGKTIPDIFTHEGESGFRDRERRVVTRLARTAASEDTPLVLALGGGAFMSQEIREALKDAGFATVYIHASPEVSLQRAGDDPGSNRPMLQTPDVHERLRTLYAERDPIYRQADYLIETDHLSVAACSHQLRELLA